jgi:hypothetical protein
MRKAAHPSTRCGACGRMEAQAEAAVGTVCAAERLWFDNQMQ